MTLDKDNEKKLNNFLNKQLKNFDLVAISDYGHGFISDRNAALLSKKAKSGFKSKRTD